MSFSGIAAKQREKEQKALRTFLTFSFSGSVALHVLVLTLSSLWVKTPELAEKPIGVMVVDMPSLQAAKPKGGAVAIGGSSRGSVATSGSRIRGGSKEGGIVGTPSTLPSKPKVSATANVKREAIASIPQSQPAPVETATTRRTSVATLRFKPLQTRSPVATLPQKPKSRPKPVATLPPKPASQPHSVSTRSPSPIATPEPKPTSQPIRVPIAQFLPNAKKSAPTQPLPARPVNPGGLGNTPEEHAAASGNRDRGSTEGSGTRDSRQSTSPSNRSGSASGTGSGNGSTVATGPRNGNGNGLTTGSASGSVACRNCPIPEYPPGAENLEGRAVVVIDVDRDGNVNDVQISQSTGHDILDQRVLETVKQKWKFTSSENGQRIKAAVNFATQGSDFYRQARERERLAREEQKRKRERQTR